MRPSIRTSLITLLFGLHLHGSSLSAGFASETTILDFSGQKIVAAGPQGGDLPLPRTPESARNATRKILPLASSSPKFGYDGPAFSIGYEIKCDVPSDLGVPADQLMVEDDFKMLNEKRTDTVAVSFRGDWPKTTTYSLAVVIMFPTRSFALESLAYSAGNWGDKSAKSYNDKVRHRWVVMTGGKFYVNTGFLARTYIPPGMDEFNVVRSERGVNLNDRWVPYDPTHSIFAQLDAPTLSLGDALDHVTAVGFYMDSIDFTGAGERARQWQFRLIQFKATGYAQDAR